MRHIVLLTTLDSIERNYPTYIRCIVASLLLSHTIRRDTTLHLVLPREGFHVKFVGSKLRQLRADEQSAGGLLRKVIRYLRESAGYSSRTRQLHSGIYVRSLKGEVSIPQVIGSSSPATYIVVSDYKGARVNLRNVVRDVVVVIEALHNLLKLVRIPPNHVLWSVDSRTLPLDHIIVLVNTQLDRLGV
ncbi:MAG: hypothetical protein DRJ40_09110 [Thermoprotei archaeon]|nr:MAG: hypothetical protein DRJ40_09110 [Thermoprotei archaeon]